MGITKWWLTEIERDRSTESHFAREAALSCVTHHTQHHRTSMGHTQTYITLMRTPSGILDV